MKLGLIAASIGISIFLWLQLSVRDKHGHTRFLIMFVVVNLISLVDDLYWQAELWRQWPWLSQAYLPFMFLQAPAFYWYIKSLTDAVDKPDWHSAKKVLGWHWLGALAGLVLCLPYFMLDSQLKLGRLLAEPGTLEHLGYITQGPVVALSLLLPFSLVYMLLCLRQLSSHLTTVKGYFSSIEDKGLSWLRWMVLLLLLVLLVAPFQIFLPRALVQEWGVSMFFPWFELLWLLAFGVLSVNQGPVYRQQDEFESAQSAQQASKYQRSLVSDEDGLRIENKLCYAMEVEGLQLNPSLTLRKLADHTGIAENRISQVLNVRMNTGFYDFVNDWRVKKARELIAHDKSNLLEIAFQVGFNSRSTFNQAFKKHSGQTPSEYRRCVRVGES